MVVIPSAFLLIVTTALLLAPFTAATFAILLSEDFHTTFGTTSPSAVPSKAVSVRSSGPSRTSVFGMIIVGVPVSSSSATIISSAYSSSTSGFTTTFSVCFAMAFTVSFTLFVGSDLSVAVIVADLLPLPV